MLTGSEDVTGDITLDHGTDELAHSLTFCKTHDDITHLLTNGCLLGALDPVFGNGHRFDPDPVSVLRCYIKDTIHLCPSPPGKPADIIRGEFMTNEGRVSVESCDPAHSELEFDV